VNHPKQDPRVLGYRSDGRPIYGFSGGAFDSLTTRSDIQALIPEQVSNEMLGKATQGSAVLQYFRPIPVQGNSLRFPILTALPIAYWVSGDTGLKQTTELAWSNKFLTIEEIATIMPVADNVMEDVSVNIWDEAQPLIVEAIARVLDSAVFFGVNAPSSFPTNIVAAAAAAGNYTDFGTHTAAQGGFMGDLDALISIVEQDGYDITGYLSPVATRAKFRSARDTQGRKLDEGRVAGNLLSVDGVPISYPMRNLWPVSGGAGVNGVALVGGAWDQFVVGVKSGIEFKLITEGVITDDQGNIVYNLPQQDMQAIRLKFRIGWQVANTINNDNPDGTTRYPVAYIRTVGA
jgi:HK97 family phage major capsid protein